MAPSRKEPKPEWRSTPFQRPPPTRRIQAAPVSHGDDIGPIALGAGIFGLAALGLVTALDRRRRRQIGRRSFGRHIPRPEPRSPLADLELQLRHYARAGQVFWLDHLAEMLAYAAQVAGVAPPEVVGVVLGDHGLDVLVTGDSADPPTPFERRSDRPGFWHLAFTTDPGFVDEAAANLPLPLVLATVGQSATGTVLVNLDHYRSIHITVPAEQVEGTLAAMATELAGTTAPVGTAVIAVGLGYGVVDRLEGGAVVDDLDEATALVEPNDEVNRSRRPQDDDRPTPRSRHAVPRTSIWSLLGPLPLPIRRSFSIP